MTSDRDVLRKVGRGGAGNYYSATKQDAIAAEKDLKRNLAQEVSQAISTSHSNTNQMGGRGGAGNWAGKQQEEGAGLQSTEELGRSVAEVVERGLKMPEKVHHGREKDVKP
ncbi:hypothetical protein E4U58_007552 [Claviceps cyperi]|nr:hypothetical protein E4U58_007552 [Claviceps cyperi]